VESPTGSYSSLNSCRNNCKDPSSPTRYRCDASTGQCVESSTGSYTSLNTCQDNCSASTSRYTCTGNQQCKQDPSGEYPSLSSCQSRCFKECEINKFQIPDHVWIGYDVKSEWSTNEDCTWAEISCKLKDGSDCGNREDLSGEVSVGLGQDKTFQIFQPGIYQYQLKACLDKNNESTCKIWKDSLGTNINYIEVQAVNLPWWQEIIPVLPEQLQGFIQQLFG